MPRRFLGLLTGVLLLALASPAFAGVSGSPAAVGVRVEGASDTLLARTALITTTAAVVKDGDPLHACTGTSAAGALDLATAGSWAGAWSGAFATYGVDTVLGETHVFGSGSYWSLFLNGYAASSGICGIELQAGDELLLAPIPEAGGAGVLTLSGVPAAAKPGQPFTVTVTRSATDYLPPTYDPVNSSAPAAGVTVAGGGASATTGADGTASLTLTTRGPASIRATKAGEVRSATAAVCISDGADGSCGTTVPVATPPVATPAADTTPASPTIAAIGEQQRFKRGAAPREVKGVVANDASGVRQVLLRLTRRSGRRCEGYDGAAERWVRLARCGAEHGSFFVVGSGASWSYLLPSALGKGRYVLDVRTVDGAGNVTRGADRGAPGAPRTRVVFHVS